MVVAGLSDRLISNKSRLPQDTNPDQKRNIDPKLLESTIYEKNCKALADFRSYRKETVE